MQTCTKCGLTKTLEEFDIKRGGRQSYCKECKKAYNKDYYVRTAARYKDQRAEARDRMRVRAQQAVIEYLQTHPCVDCGEDDIVVLQFDHLRDKSNDVSRLVSNGKSVERVLAEIAKCEVRCANCHVRKTAERMGGNYRTLALLTDAV